MRYTKRGEEMEHVQNRKVYNHVPHPQHNNNDSLLHMDIPCNNSQQALPEQGPNTTVPNSPVHEATRKSSRVKRVPRRLLE